MCLRPSTKKSDMLSEKHNNIKFCVMLGKSMSETMQILKEVYGADAAKKSSVSEWFKIAKKKACMS